MKHKKFKKRTRLKLQLKDGVNQLLVRILLVDGEHPKK
jgi:hypothetical protein